HKKHSHRKTYLNAAKFAFLISSASKSFSLLNIRLYYVYQVLTIQLLQEMASANKILMLFLLIAVLLATLATSTPIPGLDKRAPVMHVSAPRSNFFWAEKSLQNVSWWCNDCKPTGTNAYKLLIFLLKITVNGSFTFV